MALVDWRGPFYAGQETPFLFQRRGNIGTTLAGGGSHNLRVRCDEWRYRSWWGYTYDGPSIAEFPLADGAISGALHNTTASFGKDGSMPFGLIMRLQDLPSLDPNTATPYTNMNLYIAGLNYRFAWPHTPTETHDNPECAVHKVINGVASQVGPLFYPRVILDVADSRFLQIEFRIQNVGPNVQIDSRWNEGTEATVPGSPGWTSWTNIGTDTSPGVLVNGGYWGFGAQIVPSGGWSGGSDNFVYVDEVRIIAGIV